MTVLSQTFDLPPELDMLARTPLARAIGMTIDAADARSVRGTLPLGAGTACEDGTLDPLAVLPFVDQLSSVPVALREAGRAAMSTINLAVQFGGVPAPGAITATLDAISQTGAARLVEGRIIDGTGAAFATCSAWFSIGSPPGGGEPPADARSRAVAPAATFAETIELTGAGEDAAELAPDTWEAVGWTGLPALHGGAVAATLARAAMRRLETMDRAALRLAAIEVRYLRPARTTGARATAVVEHAGRRTARLLTTLTIAGEVVADARVLFVSD